MKTKEFDITGMHCNSCRLVILDSLNDLGVKKADFVNETKLRVEFDDKKISEQDIKETIKKEGYKVIEQKNG